MDIRASIAARCVFRATMFAAAMLDAFPDVWPAVLRCRGVPRIGPRGRRARPRCTAITTTGTAVLTGHRFRGRCTKHAALAHEPHHHDGGEHEHIHDHDGRAASTRPPGLGGDPADATGGAALDSPREATMPWRSSPCLAEAEGGGARRRARRCGVPRGRARWIRSWTSWPPRKSSSCVGPGTLDRRRALPLGSGRVRTAHGMLPVPAPATALLMRGLATRSTTGCRASA